MTTLELKLNLPDRLAQDAGLLTPQALMALVVLLKDAIRRRATQTLLAGAACATAAGSKALSMDELQAEVDAVRSARRSKAAS